MSNHKKFVVKPIARDVVNAWPIAEAGLDNRVVHSARAAGFKKIGELRGLSDVELLKLKNLGNVSLPRVGRFFDLCKKLENGRISFGNIRQILTSLLSKDEFDVLSARYGLSAESGLSGRKPSTLQIIGDTRNVTRERIRQIEKSGLQILGLRLPTACLEPVFEFCLAFLSRQGSVAAPTDIQPLASSHFFAGMNPSSIFRLLADLPASHLFLYNGFFSAIPVDALKQLEQNAVSLLRQEARPLPLSFLSRRLSKRPPSCDFASRSRLLAALLDHNPDVGALISGDYFLFDGGLPSLLPGILKTLPLPAHYRAVQNALNDRLKPRSRKGAGFVLRSLRTHPGCRLVDRGLYELRIPL